MGLQLECTGSEPLFAPPDVVDDTFCSGVTHDLPRNCLVFSLNARFIAQDTTVHIHDHYNAQANNYNS